MRIKIKIFIITFVFRNIAFGGVEQDLANFFNNMGAQYNASAAQSYKDQVAGYYSGGSIVLRNKVRNLNPLTITAPSLRSGCGGIDVFTGGFSFINSDQLVQTLRNISANTASYVFLLGLSTMVPQIKNTITYVNDLAQKINSMSINSCEMAATAVGAVWPQSAAASDALCNRVATNLGKVSDYVQARHNCRSESGRGDYMKHSKRDPRYKDILTEDFNLAWHAIRKNNFLSSDKRLAELFMSLSGTIISHRQGAGDNETLEVMPLISLVEKSEIIKVLLEGGTTTIYKCEDDEQCLKVIHQEITLPPEQSIKAKVEQLLEEMVHNIYENKPHTPAQMGLLNSTSLPLYKFLNISSAFHKDTKIFSVGSYAEVIALDILFAYLEDILTLVQQNVSQLRAVQVDDNLFVQFNKGVRLARSKLDQDRMSAFQKTIQTLNFIQKTQILETQLHDLMSNRMSLVKE